MKANVMYPGFSLDPANLAYEVTTAGTSDPSTQPTWTTCQTAGCTIGEATGTVVWTAIPNGNATLNPLGAYGTGLTAYRLDGNSSINGHGDDVIAGAANLFVSAGIHNAFIGSNGMNSFDGPILTPNGTPLRIQATPGNGVYVGLVTGVGGTREQSGFQFYDWSAGGASPFTTGEFIITAAGDMEYLDAYPGLNTRIAFFASGDNKISTISGHTTDIWVGSDITAIFAGNLTSFKTPIGTSNDTDSNNFLGIDSGLTAGQISGLLLTDRGTNYFAIEKLATNDIGFFDSTGYSRQSFWSASTKDNFYDCPTGCFLHMRVNGTDVFKVGGSAISAYQPLSATLLNPSLGTSALSTTNTAGTGGTTANLLVTFDTANPSGVILPSLGAVGVLGIAESTATVGNPVEIATRGVQNCVADNAITAGHLVGVGTTTAARCLDLGQADSTAVAQNVQIIGKAKASASTAGTFAVQLYGPGHYGTALFVQALPNGTTATTQAAYSADAKVATDAYVNTQTPGQIMTFQPNGNLATSGTQYFSAAGSYCSSETTACGEFPMARAATISNCVSRLSSTLSGTMNYTFVFRINAGGTSCSLQLVNDATHSGGTVATDSSHSCSWNANDLVDWQSTANNTPTASAPLISCVVK